MNFLQEETGHTTFKNTRIIDDAVPQVGMVADALKAAAAKGKLAIIADYAVGAAHEIYTIGRIASALEADIYAAPFHVQGTVNPLHPNFRGQLPSKTREINEILGQYHTALLIGKKIDTLTYDGVPAVPASLQIIQIAPATSQLGFDFPCDLAVLGDVRATLDALVSALGAAEPPVVARAADEAELDNRYGAPGCRPSDALILAILRKLDRHTHVITEGSSEDAIVQDMAVHLGFRNVHFSPRGGGLGWAMPLGVGIGLATQRHAVCFVGDGGSLFSIHAIWTAAKYRIPSIFVCFVNNEYRLLKDLWCNALGTTFENTHFVGLDFNDPDVDLQKIAEGLGARVETIGDQPSAGLAIDRALGHSGPTFLIIKREA